MPEKPSSEPDWGALVADQMRLHGKLFYRIALRILYDEAAAEDVCQQALLKALSGFNQIRNAGSLRSWLAKVVVTESLAVRRRRKVETKGLAGPAIRRGDVENEAAVSDRRNAVLDAVETLAEPTRTIVIMRLMDGMRGCEVAEALDWSEAFVSRHMHSGMALLRVALDEWKVEFERKNKDK